MSVHEADTWLGPDHEALRAEVRAEHDHTFFQHDDETLNAALFRILQPDRLQQLLEADEAGDTLHAIARYSGSYRPEACSPELWMALLGKDVDDRAHGHLTALLAAQFAEESGDELTPDETKLLILGSWAHDLGESVAGEPAYHAGDRSSKTEALVRRQLTRQFFLEAVHEASPETFRSTTETRAITQLADSLESVVAAKQGKLPAYFNAIERTGYLRTAGRAGRLLASSVHQPVIDATPGLRDALTNLNIQVTLNHVPQMLVHSKAMRAVRHLLRSRAEDIDNAIELGHELWGDAHCDASKQPLALGDVRRVWRHHKAAYISQHG